MTTFIKNPLIVPIDRRNELKDPKKFVDEDEVGFLLKEIGFVSEIYLDVNVNDDDTPIILSVGKHINFRDLAVIIGSWCYQNYELFDDTIWLDEPPMLEVSKKNNILNVLFMR